jgi:hypothetical protein
MVPFTLHLEGQHFFDLWFMAFNSLDGFFTYCEQYHRVLTSLLPFAWLCTGCYCIKQILDVEILHVVLHKFITQKSTLMIPHNFTYLWN